MKYLRQYTILLHNLKALSIIHNMADRDFIKENIVGRRDGWKKVCRHYLRVVFSAILFGIISTLVIVFALPRIQGYVYKEEPETVVLETESQETMTESTVEETETVPESEAEADKTEPTETPAEEMEPFSWDEMFSGSMKKYYYSPQDYGRIHAGIKALASKAEKSLVEVKCRIDHRDLFGKNASQEKDYSGVILAVTSEEIMILTPGQAAESDYLEVTFPRGEVLPAVVKAVDHVDSLAIISVSRETPGARSISNFEKMHLGNAGLLQKGDVVLGVGCPIGELHSIATGTIGFISYNNLGIDGAYQKMLAEMNAISESGTFILNMYGELVGWLVPTQEGVPEGIVQISSISDYMGRLEALTNGMSIPYLGITAQDVTSKMAEEGLPQGVYIRECAENGPAYNIGIQSGDILISMKEESIADMTDFRTVLNSMKKGDTIPVTVMRQRGTDYTEMAFELTVDER